MKPSAREILEKINSYLHSQITYYRFNKNVLKVSDKYRDGRLAALQYASELSLYYMHLEKSIKDKYRDQILQQMKANSCLKDGDYKKGLYDGLNDALDAVSENQDKPVLL